MKIAIASGKGGTGKTTLSTNLASLLAESKAVVLADLDVEEPNSGLFLQAEPFFQTDKYKYIPQWEAENCTLCGNCQQVCNFNAVLKLADRIMVFPELCHACFACSELCPTNSLPMIPRKMGELRHLKLPNLDFVESKLLIGEEQAVPLIAQTLQYLDENFSAERWQILDSPPGTSCPVIEATKAADLVILVTEPTPFGLHDLSLAVDTMRQLKKDFAVVINRFGLGDAKVEEYCQKHKIPIIAKIPNQRQIAELYSAGKLIYPSLPQVRRELEKVRDFILQREEV
ncbi:MAG: ATP-binding protein [Candidatus Cloacimonadales bacterium]